MGHLTALLAGIGVARYLRRIARNVQVLENSEDGVEVATLRARFAGRRLVFCYWIEDILPLLLAGLARGSSLRSVMKDVEFLCDDSLGGRTTVAILDRLGRKWRLLHWFEHRARVQDIQELIRYDNPIGIAVDGHGPYGNVGSSFARLLEKQEAVAVPIGAQARPSWSVRLRARLSVPRPSSKVAVVSGSALDATVGTKVLREALQESLDQVRRQALAALAWRSI
jgi:hypothetical protein